jgi:hypothetical protein
MANPSTTGAGGAGTEVLRRAYVDNVVAADSTVLTCPQHHIFTILSIIVNNRNTSDVGNLNMWIDYNGGGTDLYFINTEPIPKRNTFVFNDRFVMSDQDVMQAYFSVTGADIWVTYIDQQVA